MNWETLSPILISVGVISATIAAIANVFVSIINNRRLKLLEKYRRENEIEKYRYIQIHDMLVHWDKYSEIRDEDRSIAQVIIDRAVDGCTDNEKRYRIVRPLLDQTYINLLDELQKEMKEAFQYLITAGLANSGKKEESNAIAQLKIIVDKFENALVEYMHKQLLNILLNNMQQC